LTRRILLAGVVAALLLAVAVAGIFTYYDRNLPRFDALTDYRPRQVTKVYCSEGTVCGEFFHERRTVVQKDEIPELLKKAVIAAEDASFYSHTGLDYRHIAIAMVKDALHLGKMAGASTITQQVVKTFLLSPERKLSRKVKEAILARRLEKNLSKEEILALYLNQIYFGHDRYGIEEAAQYYFGHTARKLTLGEAAMLAGIPNSPNRINPVTDPAAAKLRQIYVLQQMARNGFIPPAEATAEIKRPLVLAPRIAAYPGPYYLEEVRKQLERTYGPERLYEGGLSVQIAMDPKLQRAAELAVDKGLRDLDKRQGYRGPLAKLGTAPPPLEAVGPAPRPPATDEEADSPEDADNDTRPEPVTPAAAPHRPSVVAVGQAQVPAIAALRTLVEERLKKGIPREPGSRVVWDLSGVSPDIAARGLKAVATWTRVRVLEPGIRVGGIVESVSDKDATARVDLGTVSAVLRFEDCRWARPYNPATKTARPKGISAVVEPGDIVLVEVGEVPRDPRAPLPAKLEQAPEVQGALVSLDPVSRQVVALVGGSDFAISKFNRATQAHRQPGSSFKPFVWAAAFSTPKYTPATLVNDAPELIRDPWTGKEWKPVNFERDAFDGPMTLRKALAESKNTVAVRLIEDLTPDPVIDMARRAGIASPIPQNLTIALGTAEVTPLEHANAYATLAAGGRRADPILLLKVTDKTGAVLESHTAQLQETIPATIAFLTTAVMESVITEGTGARAQALGRPAAGKTGTAQDQRDAWFAGYTPDLCTVAWTGFDNHDRLGHEETGAHAALPIWLAFMQAAEKDRPTLDFAVPPGVIQVRVDPRTGLLSPDDTTGRMEYFADGTQPKETAAPADKANPSDLFFEDQGKRR
jgi:penicillin-binding protein 1A